MDDLDVAILRTMGIEPYTRGPRGPDALKPGTIARALDVTPETVRERVQRMEAKGLIAGYQVFVNLRHLGLEAGSFLFDMGDEQRRAAVVPQLEPFEGILSVHTFLGPEVCVDLSFRSTGDLARRIQVLGALTGDPTPVQFLSLHMPQVERPLTNLDWRIIRALRSRGKRSLAEVAEEIGVGYRTVKRRFDRLCEEGSIYVVPMLDPGKERGMMLVWLLFFLAPGAPKETPAALQKAFGDRHLMGMYPRHERFGNFALLLVADTPAQAEAMRRSAASMPGVARTSALVPTEAMDCTGWLDEVIEAKIAETRRQPEAEAA